MQTRRPEHVQGHSSPDSHPRGAPCGFGSEGFPLRLGISACLLGQTVRYDGKHKRADTLLACARDRVQWIPVCPEAECGLGVPRAPVVLAGDPNRPRLLVERSGQDLTDRMLHWSLQRIRALGSEGVRGFVLKSRSPSCGKGNLRLVGSSATAAGLFAGVLLESYPSMPVEEESALGHPSAFEDFLGRASKFAPPATPPGT